MIGSAIAGEDVVQDTLVKALEAYAQGADVNNLEGWLFRIAHNASLDHLRAASRGAGAPFTDVIEAAETADPDVVALSFETFLQLPALQRCAVILKDVLGHSIGEIAVVADCSPAAAKSALQRGRAALRAISQTRPAPQHPPPSVVQQRAIARFVRLFRAGDFDEIRAMLAVDVQLDLVNRLRLTGREAIEPYFTRYAETPKWRFELGVVEGRPAMLVFDGAQAMQSLAHFVMVGWSKDQIIWIKDYLFAPYVLERLEWARLD
jgi:RNA polymerase sigma-70 factor (ECF subfamily)